jgi:hypothetical protein
VAAGDGAGAERAMREHVTNVIFARADVAAARAAV